jgi:CRP-like cAMP-binding protein
MRVMPGSSARDTRNRALASLPDRDYEILRPHLRYIELDRESLLRRQDMAQTSVYFPLTGMISTVIYLSDGRSVEAAMTGSEGMADISALGTGLAFGDLLVQGQGEAFMIEASHLKRAMNDSPAISRMVSLASEVSTAYSLQSLACLNFHQLEARFCRWMLMARYQLRRDEFKMTHDFMAAMLGVQRTSVTLVANKLQKSGLIDYKRGEIAILDVEGLESASCECYRHMTMRIERAFPPTGK